MRAYNEGQDAWLDLSRDLEADILFFTNPHAITKSRYYSEAFQKHLSCYVPYAHQVSRYDDYQAQYNQFFHNALWILFAPHEYDKEISTRVARNKGRNVVVSGYPALEQLRIQASEKGQSSSDVWKQQAVAKKRIIYAPHHTIDAPDLPYASFLKYAEFFAESAEKYADTIQWAFKPHPFLRQKLYLHQGWGRDRTDKYYEFWASSENTQLEEGEYLELFDESDAMIHDSGSFLAEYHYTLKPVMFLKAVEDLENFLNEFGRNALNACYQGTGTDDIEGFINMVLDDDDPMKNRRVEFVETEISPYFADTTPSKSILSEIKGRLTG